ncbi:putative cytochrome P450 oxidoreductase [Lepidopterella palustris CBS 459.81]|uniref:Putative cytochrome P450 oxidoreductase n=1 Tax=Lepidopterella palustris CBS 459.81 TaxID=1314670 RepID=A0A8E2DZU2_9PEZI|nr:putative cytochrome P450 oxidoreductase [Lepidopterella palustris CBS 459.81]
MAYTKTLAVVAALALYGIYRLSQLGKRDPRMPKGPPTMPILGNMHQISTTGIYRQFKDWAKEYGGIFSLKFGSGNAIVLCDRKAIHELLDKKGLLYSERPITYVGNIVTGGDHMIISSNDMVFREKRKIATHNFAPRMLDAKHVHVQEAEATVLLNGMLQAPDDMFNHVRRYTASVASILTFGQRAPTYDSWWGHNVYEILEGLLEAMEPGANPPVDEYPILQYLPKRFFFWKRRAWAAREALDSSWTKGRAVVEARRAKGIKRDCIADTLLDEYEAKGWPMTQHAFNNLLGELVEAGADTTASQILTLMLAFAKHPHVVKKAQKEIDAVCGPGRPPTWADFKDLPYINCIVKEGLRWRPVATTALPHRNKEDDVYNGMLIPKNSTIFIPVWALHMDEKLYPEPDTFNPDRFLNHPKLANDYAGSPDWNQRDHYGYGAGRRLCPGIHFAERNQWRIAAKILWAFDILEPLDPVTGEIQPLDTNHYAPGLLMTPLPFKVRLVPRSPEHEATIKSELDAALEFLSPWE